jgi:hypothetical protein
MHSICMLQMHTQRCACAALVGCPLMPLDAPMYVATYIRDFDGINRRPRSQAAPSSHHVQRVEAEQRRPPLTGARALCKRVPGVEGVWGPARALLGRPFLRWTGRPDKRFLNGWRRGRHQL